MTNLERLKKLIPSSHSYTESELTAILTSNGNNAYQAAAEIIRGLCSQALAGSFQFWSGEVKVDKSKIIENYLMLADNYETRATNAPASQDELWGDGIDKVSSVDRTNYSEEDVDVENAGY